MGGRVMRLKIDDIVDKSKAEGKIEEVKKLIKEGLTTLADIENSGLYTSDELKAIAAP